MDPVGIEPTPLDLQTSVRTSYTKGPVVGAEGFEPPTYAGYLIYSQAPNQFERYSQFLYLVVESNYCHFHVKEIRSHYANEAIFVPPPRIELGFLY